MAGSGMNVKFRFGSIGEILKKRGLDGNGKAQQIVDSEVVRYIDMYIPFDTGTMRNSMITATQIGSGEVCVNTPYAHRRLEHARKNGLRGPDYFNRMKADRKDDILRAAAAASGGEARK